MAAIRQLPQNSSPLPSSDYSSSSSCFSSSSSSSSSPPFYKYPRPPLSPKPSHPHLPTIAGAMAEPELKSVHDFSVKDIRGKDVSLKEYAGKVLLIVNVASKCGLTDSNYKELNVLYEKYRNQGFEILAFPCNQFRGQEPGSNEEIQETVCTRFKAEFPIFEKIEVNGKNTAPIYQYLKAEKGGLITDGIKWNFTKFLVDKEGKVVERYGPMTAPLKIEKDIQDLLS